MRSTLVAVGILATALLTGPRAWAVTFVGSATNPEGGSLLSAKVEFTKVGSDLQVKLSNIGADVMRPSDLLSAVFFDIAGNPILTPVSGMLAPGSVVHFGPDGAGNIGGEWAYKRDTSGLGGGTTAPVTQVFGISSSGFDIFGPMEVFPGSNLEGPAGPDGMNYGLTNDGDDTTMGNAAVTGGAPLIEHAVIFTLSGFGAKSESDISNIRFQYGTGLTEAHYNGGPPPVPEPGTLSLLGLAVAPMVKRLRRRRA